MPDLCAWRKAALCAFIVNTSEKEKLSIYTEQRYRTIHVVPSGSHALHFHPLSVQGRGTQNPITGPPRDHSSSQGDSLGGAYVFMDSSFPRRPGDVARLESIEFQATGESAILRGRVLRHEQRKTTG